MMMNMFIIFDPSTSKAFSLNWVIFLMPLWVFLKLFWYKKNRLFMTIKTLFNFITKDIKTNIKKSLFINLIFFCVFFQIICSTNIFGIFPFIFTTNSQLSSSLFMAMPFWLAFITKGYFKTPSKMLAHLVPLSTPIMLCPFMVLIETISNIIRPLTLSVRLTANMIAGHILISLVSQMMNNIVSLGMACVILQALIMLETAVAVIQAYVFIVLLSLYMNEI